MHAAATAVQVTSAHTDQFDPLGKFTKHRRFNAPITRALMADSETLDIGRAIGNCACRLNLELPLEGEHLGEPLLKGARVCNRRLCPFCEWRRTRAWRARLLRGLGAFQEDYPKHSGVFLTLTVKNCAVHELRDTVRHLHASLARLTKTLTWPTEHWMRRTEVTGSLSDPLSALGRTGAAHQKSDNHRLTKIQSLHPHIHCLLLVRPSYWSRDYISQLRWQQEWQMAARLDYSPVVDVRRAKNKPGNDSSAEIAPISAVVEAAKYATKATDLIGLGDALPAFHHEMRGLRLYGISKGLQKYISSADVSAAELLDTEQLALPGASPSMSAVAQWFDSVQEYRFVT